MKFLAFGDNHGELSDHFLKYADDPSITAVLHCGDFSPRTEMNSVPRNLVRPFVEKGKKFLVIHGNHEMSSTTKFLESVYSGTVKNMHGYYYFFENGEIAIFGAGGAELGPFPTSDDEIFYSLKKSFEKIKHAKKKIMLTHAHPAGSLMEKFTPWFEGSPAVQRAIEEFKPDILICGHVHEASGMEEHIGTTRVINVANKPKIIEV